MLPEYLPASKEILLLLIVYIIFPDLLYYCNDEVMCALIMQKMFRKFTTADSLFDMIV